MTESLDYSIIKARVTYLGDFSPIGRLLALGVFLKIAEVAQICEILYFTETKLY
jgi:hypothetical protein